MLTESVTSIRLQAFDALKLRKQILFIGCNHVSLGQSTMLAMTIMRKINPNSQPSMEKDSFLPDFCFAETNLFLVLVLELIAIVLALASAPTGGSLFVHIALLSIYIQWIGLTSASVLCLTSRLNRLKSTFSATLLSLLVVAIVTAIFSQLAYRLNEWFHFNLFDQHSVIMIVAKHEAISLILYGLALRYFYIRYTSQQIIKMEAQARLQALQARIRPHFLFNNLNTIASLTHDAPDVAEQAILNLADLFRASLNAEASISLQQEIELTRSYISLETLRLDDRLQVNWRIDAATKELSIPALTLQPLVENAIYHGIEPLPEGGAVNILLKQNETLLIEISNPLNKSGSKRSREGNKMALENIHERLHLAFQGRAKIEHITENDLYKVKIEIPVNKI